jgi:hypothetical protein
VAYGEAGAGAEQAYDALGAARMTANEATREGVPFVKKNARALVASLAITAVFVLVMRAG